MNERMNEIVIIHAPFTRYFAWGMVAVVGVMVLLSYPHLPNPTVRAAATVLALLFCVLHGLQYVIRNFERRVAWYFAGQTALVALLLALPGGASEFFTFLFFMLAVEVATTVPTRPAALWIAAFFAVVVVVNVVDRGADSAVVITFDAVVFLMCSVFGYSLRQAEVARRHNMALLEELRHAQRQLQELALAEERNRMAREIHDGLGHYLTATAMQIQGAKALLESNSAQETSPTAIGALGKAESLLQEALSDVRRSVATLRDTSLPDRPLTDKMGELVEDFHAVGGPQARFCVRGTPRPLAAPIDFTLYRAAQEALTNVRKHAQASRVEVTLHYEAERVRLDVDDDGRGYGDAGAGFGLLGLRERVQLLGGSVATHAAPEQGFRLEVEIPT
jgi:signal transduction histidine kinase